MLNFFSKGDAMEVFVSGLQFGLGFLAAVLIIAAAIFVLVLIGLFIAYLAGKKPSGKRAEKKGSENGSDSGW